MENYTYPHNAQIIKVIGEVRQVSSENFLQVGDTIEANNTLVFTKNSELTLSLEDGSQQRVYHSNRDLNDEILFEKVSTVTNEQSNENTELNNVQDDITAIQDLITSGEDVELPDTAAGLVGNEGTGFVSVNRIGDETLAAAGVDSNELQNDLTSSNAPDQSLVSSLSDDDEIDSTNEDTAILGNVLNNSENPSTVISDFEIEGTTYETGTTAALDEGELTLSEDGSYTFVPSDDYNGLVPVATYTLEDGTGARDTSTLSITVTPLPDIIDEDEIVTTNEDITITGNVLTNSSSPDDPITVTGFEVAGETYEVGSTAILEEGELTLNENGDYTFIPSENYNGSVPVTTYTLIDGAGDEDTSTLTIAIDPVQDLVDDDEAVNINEDTSVTGNVLINATSPDNPITVTSYEISGTTFSIGTTASITEGDLTLNADGSYIFVPSDNFNGTVPVATYTVEDGVGDTDTSTLSITVTPMPDLIDGDENVNVNEDTTLTGNVLTNASSPDNPLTVNSFSISGVSYNIGDTAGLAEGDLTLNANGNYTFVPSPNYNGAVPVVTYTVEDGAGDTDNSTLSITVTPVSDLIDGNENVSTSEDTVINGNVLTNSSSPDNPVTVTSFSVSGISYNIGDTANLVEGNLTLNANGNYTFDPSPEFSGNVPVVTYTVEDGAGDTDNSSLSIRVVPAPPEDSPTNTIADSNATAEDTTLTVTALNGVLANDSDADDILTVASFTVDTGTGSQTSFTAGQTALITGVGSLTLNGDGGYTFDPVDNFTGPVPVATYTTNTGASNTLTLIVTPENDPTNTIADSNTTAEDITLTVTAANGVLANDTDTDDTLTVASFTVDTGTGSQTSFTAGQTALITGVGSLTLNGDGGYTFDPADNYNGPVPVATYTTNTGASDTLTLTVTPVNDPTITAADSNTTAEDITLTVTAANGVLANDTDTDDTLTVASFTVDTGTGSQTSFTAGQTALITGVGSLTLNGDGGYTFDPADNYNGPVPIATYTTNTGASDTLTITVTPVNDEPVAENDSFSVEQSGTVTGNIITQNDGDGIIDHDGGDGSTLNVTHVNGAQLVFSPLNGNAVVTVDGGTLTIDAQGDFTYQNTDGFVLGSSYPKFEYTLSDGIDDDTAEVTITINDTAPLAVDDNNYIQYRDSNGESVRTGVRGNIISSGSTGDRADSSADGNIILTQIEYNGSTYQFDALNTSFNINTGFGTLAILNTGYYTYTLDSGIDINTIPSSLQFTYTIKDGDTINPETDDAILTVNLTHFQTSPRAAKSSNDDELIDLSFIEQTEQDNVNEEINISSPTAELSDLFSDNNHNVLHELLSFNSISEEEPISPDHELILDNTDPNDVNSNEDTIVTNGFLKEGARLQGDITPENVPQHTEIDSNDIL